MQFNTFVASIADLDRCVNAPGLQEVLLEPALLARQGHLSPDAVQTLAGEAAQRGLRPVLVWDALMPERVMRSVCEQLSTWNLEVFGAIRVSDPGVAYWLQSQVPQMPLQLIVETGNHNLEALVGWCQIFAGTLERLILSIELPEAKLIEYCQKLPVACELLGVGQILLFYSPRSLLASHLETDDESLATTVAFADAPQRPFPTVETAHGTCMFLDKDQFILDRLSGLKSAGLHTVRLDVRHLSQDGDAASGVDRLCQQILSDPAALRVEWSRPTRAPFFNANRTDALFPRMKSKVEQYRADCLAEVISGEKAKYVVFQTRRSGDRSQIQRILLPTGEAIDVAPELTFRTVNGETIHTFEAEQILVTDWIKKAVPGSLLMG